MAQLIQTVALEGIRFFSDHGYYPEEQKVGNEFLVDIGVRMMVKENLSDELSGTLNYERLFDITAREMKITSKLLETVAHRILKSVLNEYPDLKELSVSIRKMNLPLKGSVNSSIVKLEYSS